LAAWAEAVLEKATKARPEMPVGVEDRAADVWEPLIAVADLAGGDWPKLARRAATELMKAARQIEPSVNIRLLADLRTIFESEESLSTKDVLARLCSLEDAPWNDFKGKPISHRQLSQRLGEYGVKPKTVRIGASTIRGYTRADVYDVRRRYLPPLTDEVTTSATSATPQSFPMDNVADDEVGYATSRVHPRQGSPHVAVVADDVAACCAASGPKNPYGTSDVAHVAHVAPSTESGGGSWRVDGALQPPSAPRRRTRI
jgi:hypothetical protein